MAATRILSWVVMISLHIQVDAAAAWTTADSATRIPLTTETTSPPAATYPTTFPIIADELQLRLSGGPNWCAGNVEIYYFGAWEKVCGYLWDMQDAEVVCRQLGCGSPLAATNSFTSSSSYLYAITEVNCAGYENYLWQCPYHYQYQVCHHGDASVICSDSGITVTPTAASAVSSATFPTSWTAGTPSCGGLLQELSGSIQSPGYPSSYPNNAYCVWRIQLWDPARRIQLQFTDVQLESSTCSYDAIEVYDGGSPQSQRLGLVCSNDHRVFNSSGPRLTVLFRSDGSVTRRGFHAYYSSFLAFKSTMAPSTSNWRTTLSSASEDYSCGGLLSSSSGTLQSPFYPGNYPNNANCVWEIQVKNNFRVILVFADIQMEGGRCLSDYVEIYDGPLHTSPLLGKICSGYYHTYTSSSNLLSVRFHSNSRYTYRGFQANYHSTPADGNTTLQCLPDYMHVVVSRSFLQSHGYSAWNLTLNDPFCTPNITSEYVTFHVPYTGCGTVREGNNNTISYSNVIRGSSSSTLITRNRNLRLRINCKMLQNTWAQTMYVVGDNFEVNETQYGRYDASLTFYDSSDFSRPVYDSPYYVNINQDLFLEASLHSPDPSLELFLHTCVASPSRHNPTTGVHTIIKDGCVKDPTYATFYSPRRHTLRFKFNAFQSIRNNPVVYLQCQLVVCRAFDHSSRCYQGCVKRSKREASSDQESVIAVAGPIQLWEPGSEIKNERESE
ncbi:PREDICTED: deleted in malignant brain tumors 1 protein [Corvus brachyrhynchos]|uniref:deleted in malignant brain tumors 1 protein n=1 Tax=Corvus brachyrhynchos TaxID=85066 RepID=UPI0008166CFA|nr:PREDICTED: deleted in malignant brain tumors 1 protein [Corvus brachyrhynchos]